MESLPYDLLAVILRHLDPANDLRQLLSVSKSFRRNLAFITSDVGFALSHLAVASTTFDLSSFFLSLPAAAAVSVQQQSRIPRGLRWDRVPPNYHAAWIVKLGGMSLRAACVITGWSATRELITSSTACFPSPSACKSLASAFERAVTEFAGAMDAHADGDFGLAWCVLLGDSATASNVVGVYLAMGAETSAEALGVALVNAARAGHDGAAEKLVRSGRVPLAKGSTTMGKVAKAAMDGGHEKFMRMLLKVAKEVKEDGGGDVDVSPVQSAILKSAKKAASKALSTLDARTNKTLSMVVTTKSTMVRDDEPSSEANPMKDVKRRATTMAVNEIAHFGKQPLASGAMTTESPSSAAMPYLPADEKLKAKHFEFLSDFGGRPPDTVHHVLHRPSGLIMARKSVWVSADNEHEARSTAKALRKEVKVLQDLGESKNVGKFYGSYLDADRNACLCYEFMDLGSLREISRGTGAVPERFLLRIAVQALSGVAYLIDKGMNVAHIGKYGMQTYAFVELIRYFADIRPSSFHANSRGQIKLVEFIVLDNFQRNLCRNNVNDDSPYYLPPERITASSISISSASWPMGMIFAELATGRFPYPSDLSLFEVMSRIADEEPLEMPRGAGFSDGFVDLVGCCMKKEPAARSTPSQLLQHPVLQGVKADELWEWAFAVSQILGVSFHDVKFDEPFIRLTMDLLSPATIKWLQSLGIGIKHPKWDCANGVVVASILSKYFPGEETLKNFYTGSSAAAKSNNWDQLRKFFVRNGINVKLDAIHAVMNSHDAAAVRTSFLLPLPLQSIELTSLTQCLFLENLFTLLTGRR